MSIHPSVLKSVFPSVHPASKVPAALLNGDVIAYLDESLRSGVVAYGFRRLWKSYEGSALRVRRSSDNAEQDIGFNFSGWIDAGSLISFVGSGSGFVRTWYDQGSTSNNAGQSSASLQPRIVNSGSVQLNDAYTAGIKFDGTDDYLISGSNFNNSTTDKASMLVGVGSIASLGADRAIVYSSAHITNRGIGVLTGSASTTLRIAQLSNQFNFEVLDRSAAESGRRLVGLTCDNSLASGSRVRPFWNNAISDTGWTDVVSSSIAGNFSSNPITLGAQFSGTASGHSGAALDFALIAPRLLTQDELRSISTFAKRPGVMIGDSTTANYLATEVGAFVYQESERFRGQPIQTIAVPGETIAQQKSRWQSCVQRANAAWVSVQIGLNDINPSISTAATIAELQDLLTTIRSDNATCKIIGMTMTPAYERWTAVGFNPAVAQAKWVAMNDAIMGRGSSPITGFDARTEAHTTALTTLVSGNAALNPIYDVGDKIHTNNAGRAINGDALHDVLVTLGFI